MALSELLLTVGANGGVKNVPDGAYERAEVHFSKTSEVGAVRGRATPNLNQPRIMRGALGQLCHKTEGHMRIKESTAEFGSRLTGVCCVKSEEETVRIL